MPLYPLSAPNPCFAHVFANKTTIRSISVLLPHLTLRGLFISYNSPLSSSPTLAGDTPIPSFHLLMHWQRPPRSKSHFLTSKPQQSFEWYHCVVIKGIRTNFHSAIICHGCNTKCSTIVSDEGLMRSSCFCGHLFLKLDQLTMTMQGVVNSFISHLTHSLVNFFQLHSFEMWVARAK